MKYLYDLHIHSALSPCADNSMTPVSIVAQASAIGLEIIAVTDHNSSRNVRSAVEVGEALDVLVVPGVEIQTNEDVHVVCYFPDCDALDAFMAEIPFTDLLNDAGVFGEQLVVNSDDEVTDTEKRLLLCGAEISETELYKLALRFGGVAVPAHVDREAYAMPAVLGGVPDYYKAVEFSAYGGGMPGFEDKVTITDSDAHYLEDIGRKPNFIELPERTAEALIRKLRGE